MSDVAARATARDVLFPSSVAVFGASEDVAKYGGRIMHYLIKHGYGGRLVPINPRRELVFGIPCYAKISAAPGAADVAVLAVPAAAVVDSVQECAAAGVKCCVIITKGFAEIGPEGAAQQETLAEIVRHTGLRIVGPNCMGIINPYNGMALISSRTLDSETMIRGRIGLISQSGALMVSMYDRAHDAGIGFRCCVSPGNQVDMDVCDFMEYMLEDEETRAICLYVEGFRSFERFLQLSRACHRAGKPVLMVKAGRTAQGAMAARSHTASMVGSFAAIEAACHEVGVLLADDVDGMVEAASFIIRWGAPSGTGIGVLSPSGGGIAITVDRLVQSGMRIATLAPATKDRLLESMVPTQAGNPLDLGGCLKADPATAAASMAALAADPDVAVVLVVLTTATVYEEKSAAMARAALDSGKPILVSVTPGSIADQVRGILRTLGCPFTDRIDDAVRIVGLWMRYGEVVGRRGGADDAPPLVPDWAAWLPDLPDGPLTEVEVKALMRACGIPVNRGEIARSPAEAVAVADRLGYPVALKIVSRGVVHKSDVDGVRLHLRNAEETAAAFRQVMSRVAEEAPDCHVEGCLVQEMVEGDLEMIVGIKHASGVGSIVLVGAGGIFTELLTDVAVSLAPVGTQGARRLLGRLRVSRLLDGTRGKPPLDVAAVADVVSRMSELASQLGDRLVELEINPLLVRRAGQGVVAVDGRATLVDSTACVPDGRGGSEHPAHRDA